jgi:hypothetical protein
MMTRRATNLPFLLQSSGLSLATIALAPSAQADVALRAEAPPPNESASVPPIEVGPRLTFGPGNTCGDGGAYLRFHFGPSVALTLRIGYRTTTLGVSFL